MIMFLFRVQFCCLSILCIVVSTYIRRMMRDYRVYTCIQDLIWFCVCVCIVCIILHTHLLQFISVQFCYLQYHIIIIIIIVLIISSLHLPLSSMKTLFYYYIVLLLYFIISLYDRVCHTRIHVYIYVLLYNNESFHYYCHTRTHDYDECYSYHHLLLLLLIVDCCTVDNSDDV